MKGWETYCLSDVITIKHGWAFKGEFFSEEPTDDILLTPGNFFIGGGFKGDKLKYYKGEYPKDYLLKAGDVIVTMTDLSKAGDTLGYSAKVPLSKSKRYLHNQRIGFVKLKDENFDLDFIHWLLRTQTYQSYIAASASGATVRHTSPTKIGSYKFKAPSDKNIQSKIASMLSAYDDLMENNLEQIKLLEESAQTTFNDWFEATKSLPKSWTLKKLKEVANITMGQSPESKYYNDEKIGLPFHQGVTGYGFRFPENETWSSEGTRFAEKGDILFSVRAPVGRLNIAIEKIILGRGLGAFRHKQGLNSFLFYQLRKIFFKEDLMGGGSIFNSVTKTDVEKIEIIEADNKTMKKFNDFAKNIDELIENLTYQNRLLKEARDILLPRLMTGRIKVEATETKVISIAQPKQKEVTWEFKEAVLIAMLTERFGNEKYPLGRKRYTKLSYLFHRHADNQMQNYLRKAAGPYNPKTKYGGPEKILHENKYVSDHTNGKLTGFVAGAKITEAKKFFENYWSIDYLNWLDTNFHYKSNDQLELYATVDNAMVELHEKNKTVNVEAVKQIIKTEKEWKAKLEREIFNDANIQKALTFLPTIYTYN